MAASFHGVDEILRYKVWELLLHILQPTIYFLYFYKRLSYGYIWLSPLPSSQVFILHVCTIALERIYFFVFFAKLSFFKIKKVSTFVCTIRGLMDIFFVSLNSVVQPSFETLHLSVYWVFHVLLLPFSTQKSSSYG